MRWFAAFLVLAIVLAICRVGSSQMSYDQAMARLAQRLDARRSPPTTVPSIPDTQPASIGSDRRIAFVLDASGSMTQVINSCRLQILLAIDRLRADQRFNIIVFHGQIHFALRKAGFVPVTARTRADAKKFLEGIEPRDETDPVKAVQRAACDQADVIWFISDGDMPDGDGFAQEIDSNLSAWHGRLNAAVFCGDVSCREFMFRLAHDNHGVCIDASGALVEDPTPSTLRPTTSPATTQRTELPACIFGISL